MNKSNLSDTIVNDDYYCGVFDNSFMERLENNKYVPLTINQDDIKQMNSLSNESAEIEIINKIVLIQKTFLSYLAKKKAQKHNFFSLSKKQNVKI